MVLLVLATSGALLPRQAFGISDEAKRKYIEGVRLTGDDDCDLAVRRLREAIASDSREGAKKFRGTGINYEDYFPHYYLGVCLEKLGQGGEALREFQESERQGAIKSGSSLARSRSESLRRLASAVQPTPVVVAQARPTPAPTNAPPPTPLPTAPPQRTVVPRPTSVTIVLPTAPPAARPTATEPARPAATRPPPTQVPAQAKPTMVPTPSPHPEPTRPISSPPAPTAPAPKEEVRIPDDTLADLRSGIRSYFLGNFDDAITRLQACEARSNTARYFLAYSLAGKYLLMGREKDPRLLEQARAEYRKARSGGTKAPAETLISGAVMTILEQS